MTIAYGLFLLVASPLVLVACDECVEKAQTSQPTPGYYDQLQRHSRQIPPPSPPLSASSWDESIRIQQPPQGWPNLSQELYWDQAMIMAIKIYQGVIYVNWPHLDTNSPAAKQRELWRQNRVVALEQLISAVWLYKDFPDVEFFLNIVDKPVASNTDKHIMPFLQYAIINRTSPSTGETLDMDPFHTVPVLPAKPWCAGYSSGMAIPTPDVWIDFSMSPAQVQTYSYCVWQSGGMDVPNSYLVADGRRMPDGQDSRTMFLTMGQQAGWLARRAAVVFWRGSATGGIVGWHPEAIKHWMCQDPANMTYPSPLTFLLMNKRVYAAIMSARYPWMDVGLTTVHTEVHGDIRGQVRESIVKKPEPVASWVKKQLTLSFDGHGPPYRLPRQMLGMAPVLRVESLLREWADVHLRPGVHFEPISSDLHDLPGRAKALLKEAAKDSLRLQTIAIAARDVMVDRLNLLAQLDSVMWSVMRVKAALNYEVQSPHDPKAWPWGMERGWMPLQLPRNRHWYSPGLRPLGQTIANDLSSNFFEPKETQ